MVYAYLFEAKSIQAYLFASNKMRDVISASERLDNMINTSSQSLLFQVLTAADIKHDLLVPESQDSLEDTVHFVRCKGGAFYAYSGQRLLLERFRSAWTLTLSQLFPSLVQCDALVEAQDLISALGEGHKALAASRNAPTVSYPVATAISARAPLTGKQAVTIETDGRESLDTDASLHRDYYDNANIRHSSPLQQRFTPDEVGSLEFEQSFEDFVKRDLALIHIDGNGLGKLLIGLKDALVGATNQEYRTAFRQFSDALELATITAAKKATKSILPLIEDENRPQSPVALRPIVLGGDDLTVFVKAEAALPFSKVFCREFEMAAQSALQKLVDRYPGLPRTLTASGAIIYHKINHPFVAMSHLSEAMCGKAKLLTKKDLTSSVGPAALSLFRVGSVSQQSAGTLLDQTLICDVEGIGRLELGQHCYFVDSNLEHPQTQATQLSLIEQLLSLSQQKHNHAPVSMNRWRQMLTHLQSNNLVEANRIYSRGRELCQSVGNLNLLDQLLDKLCPANYQRQDWYFVRDSHTFTIINDLLLLEHYKSSAPEGATDHD